MKNINAREARITVEDRDRYLVTFKKRRHQMIPVDASFKSAEGARQYANYWADVVKEPSLD